MDRRPEVQTGQDCSLEITKHITLMATASLGVIPLVFKTSTCVASCMFTDSDIDISVIHYVNERL